MSHPRPTGTGAGAVPCAANPATGGGQYVHPEGTCACFRGGPAPVWVSAPEIAVLGDRPGVFDTSWIGQATRGWTRDRTVRGRVRAWLRRRLGR
jgi:hypothetical protein